MYIIHLVGDKMKVTTTIRIDGKVLEKAGDIIRNKLNSSVSAEVENYFKEIIKHNSK